MRNRIFRHVRRAEPSQGQPVERAIANATVTTTANFSSFSNGTKASPQMRKTSWAPDPFLTLAERMIVDEGYTQGRAAALAEYADAADQNENADTAAVTPTALGTITTSSSTLGEAAIGIAYSSQALTSLDDKQGFLALVNDLAIHAVFRKMAADLDALASGLTTNSDRAGLTANWATVQKEVEAIRSSKGARVKCVVRTAEKVKNELLDDLRSQGATYLAGSAAQAYVKSWPTGAQLDIDSLAFVYDDIAVYVANLQAQVLTSDAGVNILSIVMVPSMPAQGGNLGTNEVIPAFALFGRENPSERRDAEGVASVDGIGISRYPVPVEENAEEWVYVANYDAVKIDNDATRAFKSVAA